MFFLLKVVDFSDFCAFALSNLFLSWNFDIEDRFKKNI